VPRYVCISVHASCSPNICHLLSFVLKFHMVGYFRFSKVSVSSLSSFAQNMSFSFTSPSDISPSSIYFSDDAWQSPISTFDTDEFTSVSRLPILEILKTNVLFQISSTLELWDSLVPAPLPPLPALRPQFPTQSIHDQRGSSAPIPESHKTKAPLPLVGPSSKLSFEFEPNENRMLAVGAKIVIPSEPFVIARSSISRL